MVAIPFAAGGEAEDLTSHQMQVLFSHGEVV